MKRAAALAATVLLTAGTVSACGSSPSVTPATSASPTAAALPSGWQRATAPKAKLSLGVPGDWTVVTGASVASNPAMAQRVAQLFHVSDAQVPQLFKQLDIMAFSPKITDNFDTNVNVTLTPLAGMPTEAVIRAGYQQLHATVVKITHVSTPLGDAVDVAYRLDQLHAQGEEVYVQTSAGIAGVTVAAPISSDPTALMAQILQTLQAKN